jgi:hypothetical protein
MLALVAQAAKHQTQEVLLGKGIQKLVKKAAKEATDGCTLTLFRNAAEHRRLNARSGGRRIQRHTQPVFSIEALHEKFVQQGGVPNFVENYVRGGHYL